MKTTEYKCAVCGIGINEGEYNVFGVCDYCFDKNYKERMKTTEGKTEEGEITDERLLIKRIWSRAYLDREESHIELLKAYADQQVKFERNKVLDEAIKLLYAKAQWEDGNGNGQAERAYDEAAVILESLKIKQP